MPKIFTYPDAKSVVICGDIHGDNEREQMDLLLKHLLRDQHPVSHWFYGHFHQSWHGEKQGILFKMLDIMELHELR